MTTAPRFKLGRLMATSTVLNRLREAHRDPLEFIRRHQSGDWGEVESEDREANVRAVAQGDRILSVYHVESPPQSAFTLWILTEADRSMTTLLLPREY